MSLCLVKKDKSIFEQHSVGNFFYIIKKGTVELLINGEKIKDLSDGESFGELALLHGTERSGTIRCLTNTYLWCLERKNFRKIIDFITKVNYDENKKFIESVPILSIFY